MNLNASSASPNYAKQYMYIRNPSLKKPLAEIDPEPFHSPNHPTGDVLRIMLQRADQTTSATMCRARRGNEAGGQTKRPRLTFGDVADIVARKEIRSANDLLMCAKKARESGDPRLTEFCGRQKSIADALKKVQEYLDARPGGETGPGAVHHFFLSFLGAQKVGRIGEVRRQTKMEFRKITYAPSDVPRLQICAKLAD